MMQYSYFGVKQEKVSALTVGAMSIGVDNFNDGRSEAFIEMVNTAIAQGVNIIDTAPRYGNGTSEKIVGRAVKNIRDKVLLVTKFGSYRSVDNYDLRDASYRTIIRECESSLLNLGVDYIDIYINHWPDPMTLLEESMAALNYLKKRGLIRYIGFSNCDKEHLNKAMRFGNVDVFQCNFSLVSQENKELMKWCHENGIMTMSYGSLGSSILSGRIRNEEDAKKCSHLSLYDYFREPKFSKVMQLLNVLDFVAERHKVPVSQVALNWSRQQDYVSTAIVGMSNEKHCFENIHCFDWELTVEELNLIDIECRRLGLDV